MCVDVVERAKNENKTKHTHTHKINDLTKRPQKNTHRDPIHRFYFFLFQAKKINI